MGNNTTSWMLISSGQGPDECCWVVAKVAEQVLKDASTNGYKSHVLETVSGSKCDIFKSVLIAIEGTDIDKFVSRWEGTIQWIGKSSFRPKHKRKNWFVGVTFHQLPKNETIRSNELKIETMRSSGPGGQHTNKTESAIRVTHIPTGLSAVAQEERSQHMNRKLAMSRLYEQLEQNNKNQQLKQQQERWISHNSLERGNPIRVYEGLNFRLKKS